MLVARSDGAPRRVALLRDGDHFGEVALLRNLPRSATVKTTCPTVVLSLQRRHFLDLIASTPGLRATLVIEADRRIAQLA